MTATDCAGITPAAGPATALLRDCPVRWLTLTLRSVSPSAVTV